jgi:hypothetical protein
MRVFTKDYEEKCGYGAMKKQSQNKPNFRKAKMNENLFAAKDYENETAFRLRKNKANQSQF